MDKSTPFNRREFLRGVGIAGAGVVVAPVIITVDASPASASPAPLLVQPVGPDDTSLKDQDVVEAPPSPFAAPTAAVNDVRVCEEGFNLTRGNIKFGHRHIISNGYWIDKKTGVRVMHRTAHPWTDSDIAATRQCLKDGKPTPDGNKLIYECCRQDPVKGECCRIVVVNPKTCNIITSYDSCDGAKLPVPVPA